MNSQVEQVEKLSEALVALTANLVAENFFAEDANCDAYARAIAAFRSLSQPPVLDEREVIERCAKVADTIFDDEFAPSAYEEASAIIAAAIRNLGGSDA